MTKTNVSLWSLPLSNNGNIDIIQLKCIERGKINLNRQLIKILANILAIYLASYISSGVGYSSIPTLFVAGFVLWLVNLVIRPLLVLITIPVNILTLGLFSLVINTWMVLLVGKLVSGFMLGGFWVAFALALFISFMNLLLEKLLKNK